jgi:hypothetical protein
MRLLVFLTLSACAPPSLCPQGPPTFHDATGTLSEDGLAAAQREARLYDERTQRPACMTVIGWRRPEVHIDRREGEPTVRFELTPREVRGRLPYAWLYAAMCEAHLPRLPRPDPDLFRLNDPWLDDVNVAEEQYRRASDGEVDPEVAAWVAWCAAGPIGDAVFRQAVATACDPTVWPPPLQELYAHHWADPLEGLVQQARVEVEPTGDSDRGGEDSSGYLAVWPREAVWARGWDGDPDALRVWVEDVEVPLDRAPFMNQPIRSLLGVLGDELIVHTSWDGQSGTLWGVDRDSGDIRGIASPTWSAYQAIPVQEGLALVHLGLDLPFHATLLDAATRRLLDVAPDIDQIIAGDSFHKRAHAPDRSYLRGDPTAPWSQRQPSPIVQITDPTGPPVELVGLGTVIRGGDGAWWTIGPLLDHVVLTRQAPGERTQVGAWCHTSAFRLLPTHTGAALLWRDDDRDVLGSVTMVPR